MTGHGLKLERQFAIMPGKSICRMEYHEKLNVILVGIEDGIIFVLDTNLGDILYQAKIANPGERWDFSVGNDRVVVVTSNRIGIRSDYNGILLLGSILQIPISISTEKVQIELNKTEAELLYQSLIVEDIKGQDGDTIEFIKHLKSVLNKRKESDSQNDSSACSVKREKWNTINLESRHSSLKVALQGVVNELWKRNQFTPQLSIASSILERLNALLPLDADDPSRLDKSQMFSESARLNTFLNWPHRDYKWAHPVKMAQAGFYHSPSTTGEDRAMCFTCSVCLVSWEPTDEPWSEHERHAPFCPFVRGEHTHNAPLTLTYATAPSFVIKDVLTGESPILGKSSCPNAFPSCFSSGIVIVWDTLKQAKEAIKFEVSLADLRDAEPLAVAGYSDIDIKPEEAWVMDDEPSSTITHQRERLESMDVCSRINLSRVALISSGHCPPSIVVAGETISGSDEWLNSWILVYGLSPTTLTAEENVFSSEIFEMDGRSGTKQESAQFEDELFGPYTLSESDMVSDSITVFSDTNISESSFLGVFIDPVPTGGSSASSAKTVCVSIGENATEKPKAELHTTVVIVQKLLLPQEVQHCVLKQLEPTPDRSKLVAIVGTGSGKKEGKVHGAILIYNVTCDSNIVGLDPQPIAKKVIEEEGDVPVASSFVPSDTEKLSIACILSSGSLKIYSLADLSLRSFIYKATTDPKIMSVAYCSSIERLWCGTENGFVNLYYTGLTDSDDDNQNLMESASISGISTGTSASLNADLILNKPLNTASLQQLLQLTKFEIVKTPFSVNAPSCWQRIIQAQKERKHPQHLHHESDLSQSSISWRLQRNKDSKKEHLFEITFPKTANVGHFDIKFSFQLGCTNLPPIDVTLYMARNSCNKRSSGGAALHVDRGIDFGPQITNRSTEFLKFANAEVVCGPLNLSTHVDLSAQNGTLVMTSPLLLLSRGRNFFLHIKAKSLGKEKATNEDQTSPTRRKSTKSRDHSKSKSTSSSSSKKPEAISIISKVLKKSAQPHGFKDTLCVSHKMSNRSTLLEDTGKPKDLDGCDWLHEISITVRQTKPSSLPNSELERKAMLTSPEFVRRLLQVVTFGGTEVSYAAQSIALDLLIWIAAIKLCGPQLERSRYQMDFVEAVQVNLRGLVLKCILQAERSTAHKCSKLLVLCIDVAQIYHNQEEGKTFLQSLLKCFLNLLPFSISCTSAGALQWFFLLLNRVRIADPSLSSESMLEMLSSVSKELFNRTDPLHAILRTRFGLYGTPFEPDLFDVELPPFAKAYTHQPMIYAGLCGTEHGNGSQFGSNLVHLSGMKDVDFRDLLLGNPVRREKLGIISPKQQLNGLLEVEPLHFSCHASSDGTRIEKIDSGAMPSFSPLPMPQHWEPFTNMPTGEGSKKSEPEKAEQVMLLQNFQDKLNSIKLGHVENYYDYFTDMKFLEGNINLIDMITFQPNHESQEPSFAQSTVTDATGNNFTVPGYIGNPINPYVVQHSYNDFLQMSTPPPAPHHQKTATQDTPTKYGFNKKLAAAAQAQKPLVVVSAPTSSRGDESLRLLVSPWQQMMYVPPQQALVIDRMHSGARRYVVLDFAGPVLLTDLIIPSCTDLASLSIDIWLNREEIDGQRLVVASDIGVKSLAISDLQPPPICRYIKITTIGRYGMGTTKCKIPLGMFFGHSVVLPNDLKIGISESLLDIPMLTPTNIQAHLSVLGYVLEDLGCRYQLACGKLKRLLEPLAKPEIASIDHISYYLPKGKERSKLGLNSTTDQIILSSYHDCVTLQQQLNVTKNVITRLQRSLEPYAEVQDLENPMPLLQKISSDKVRLLSSFLIESLLGISFMSSTKVAEAIPYPLYANMTQSTCADLFQNICVMENGQCQLAACTLLLRVCGFQPWWGTFLTTTLKNLFSASNTSVFPQDRVFTLLVYLGQKMLFSGQKSFVLESTMQLLEEILTSADDKTTGFTRSKIDMSLLGWTVMYLCLCLDGVSQSVVNSSDFLGKVDGKKGKDSKYKNVGFLSSRWNFIQGETVLHHSLNDNMKSSSSSGMKRRMQKKTYAVKQKLEELSNATSNLSFTTESYQLKYPGLGNQFITLGQKLDALKQSNAALGKPLTNQGVNSTNAKNLKDLLLSRTGLGTKRLLGMNKGVKEGSRLSSIGINLNLNPGLCYSVTKALGSFLLKMDSTCHSDVYLLLCKSLARIATSCRPAMRLGDIFTEEQIVRLVQTAVGNDYVRQVNWSSSWISHAIICLILDILEGEKLYPEAEKSAEVIPLIDNESSNSFSEETPNVSFHGLSDSMLMDVTDAENESAMGTQSNSTVDSTMYCFDSESEYEELDEYSPFNPAEIKCVSRSPRRTLTSVDLNTSATSFSSALDARLESGMESSMELRLRLMSKFESELLAQSLTAPIDVPLEILRNVKSRIYSSSRIDEPIEFTGFNSMDLLSSCFNKVFLMMVSENCCINIEKVLLFWLSINMDLGEVEDIANMKPMIPLSPEAVKGLIGALTRNVGIGVQDWGLGFKCLSLVSNQPDSENKMYVSIITDQCFPDMILKFISGSGMNLQRNNVPAMGPTVCEDFQNFISRIFQLCQRTPWISYITEVLLRILSEFLSGPFLGAEFPQDAFNKFLDALLSSGLQMPKFYSNTATLVSIVDHFANALHLYVFFPNKIVLKSNAELKGAPPATTATGMPLTPGMSENLRKPQNLESLLVRLLSLVTDFISFGCGKREPPSGTQEKLLNRVLLPKDLDSYEEVVVNCLRNVESPRVRSVADIIVIMDTTMMRIFSVLANPNGKSSLSEEDMSAVLNFVKDPTPTTIVDFVIRLVSKLMSTMVEPKRLVRPLFTFLSKSPYEDFCCPLIVSKMFVLTVLKVIKEEENLLEFVKFGCVESICQKLVASSKQFFSSCPTFVSILMQYIGRADSTVLFGQRKPGNEVTELPGGIINVAPLGTISSVNFSAHPSEVLLQATPPHRRARTPVWSYHFYPEETFLELVVSLPCAVLLKEVQIVPHISSLATSSPSAVMLEISRDKNANMVALSPPVQCSGMTTINIQVNQPEVAQTVLLRLYKPKGSSTLGLSQIRIMGCTTFCESAFEGLSQHNSVRSIEPSAQWLYILDHSITVASSEVRERIINTAVNIPDILQACYSLLMCPTTIRDDQDSYLPHVSSVLFHFGSVEEVNQQLMTALLGSVQLAFSHGMIANTNVQSVVLGSSQLNTVVELIYKLCCDTLDEGLKNLTTVVKWLESCADEAVENDSQGHHIVPEYVQSVAAALWSVTATRKMNLSDLATHELLGKLLNWSKCLNLKSELKAAVDHMICSMCFCKPWLFVYLNYKMGIIETVDWKELENGPIENLLPVWYEEESVWQHMAARKLDTTGVLSSPLFMTLARAAQSERASSFIFESNLLSQLNNAILHFWNYHHSALVNCSRELKDNESCSISPSQLISILEFYGELCSINRFKDWFGTEGSVFWHPILHLLSIVPSTLKATCFGSYLYDLEYMVIHFLTRCCWSHPGNQKLIAARLCEIIVTQKPSPHKAIFLHSLSSFCRRLLIQILLENEKMVVHVKNQSKSQFKSLSSSLPLKDKHPSLGVNGRDRIFLISSHSSAYELMRLIEPSFGRQAPEKVKRIGNPTANSSPYSLGNKAQISDLMGMSLTDEQQLYGLEDDVLQDLFGLGVSMKHSGIKIPSKRSRSDKTQEANPLANESDTVRPTFILESEEFPDVKIPPGLNLSSVKASIKEQNPDYFLEILVIIVRNEVVGQGPVPVSETPVIATEIDNVEGSGKFQLEKIPDVFKVRPLPTTIDVFGRVGGFGLLSKHLPVVYPDTLRQMAVGSKGVHGATNLDKDSPILLVDNDWVKVENPDDFYDEMMDGLVTPVPASQRGMTLKQVGVVPGVPPHSMAAFGLFLGLPKFSEVLLGERVGAQCILRLAMGVSDDADGNDIFCSPIAKSLPTLPFQVLRRLLDLLPLSTEEGKNVRLAMFETKAIHFILACLAIFTHQNCDPTLVPSVQHEMVLAATKVQGECPGKLDKSDDKSHVYWAKGTGFGTGSTQETWSVERAMEKRITEEENITCLLQVLSSYICPRIGGVYSTFLSSLSAQSSSGLAELPPKLEKLLQSSCLFTTISLYLKNDSVLDMARHIPLYTSLLQFLRSVVSIPQFIPLLEANKKSNSEKDDQRISTLLLQMKDIVDSYSKRLTSNSMKGTKSKNTEALADELHDEGLANLISDIQATATLVQNAVAEYAVSQGTVDPNGLDEESTSVCQSEKTLDDIYLDEMKKIQFAFSEMIVEEEETAGIRFTVSHFYEGNIRTNWTRSAPTQLKRLAQESITLSTSLPIAFGSTIFVRCDTDRLDVMKVLITGPAGTPYSNGCFEFDVYFPIEYPNGPMLIHLQTTGRQRVRFNPNLYADGKVCLSILNTWHGRPEEKWNPQTSSLLPVLVAIQSLILNAEPYFNEPGYEKSRGTEGGERSSREYNAGIQIASLEWAMLDQIRHPSVCFKEVIHKHFWLKRAEIISQCEQWYEDLVTTCRSDKRVGKGVTGNLDPVDVFKNNLTLLRKEFLNMVPPPGLEYLAESLPHTIESEAGSAASSSNSVSELVPEGTPVKTSEETGIDIFPITSSTIEVEELDFDETMDT